MCGLKASSVREELLSGAVREAGQDLVYEEIKPPASLGFFAVLASTGLCPPPLQWLGGSLRWRTPCWTEDKGTQQYAIPHPVLGDLLPTVRPRCTHHASVHSRHV